MPSSSEAKRASHVTPAMRQYLDAKKNHPDAIVFFRMGDFYEMFYEDALTAARVLELTLTSRSKDSGGSPIPMCGVPHHAADGYITRLVKRGFRVAICEQVELSNKTKKTGAPLRREVVRVVSPGTLTETTYLDAKEPAFVIALSIKPETKAGQQDGESRIKYGAALIDLSTGEFFAAEYAGEGGRQSIADEISVLSPREIIVASDFDIDRMLPELSGLQLPVTSRDPWSFGFEQAKRTLCDQLEIESLEGIGLGEHLAATMAAGGLVQYLRDTQKVDLVHLRHLLFRSRADHVLLDPTTFKHLEILKGADGNVVGSLLEEIDRTITPMGGRLLRTWLQRPSPLVEPIQDRLDAVEEFGFLTTERAKLRDSLTKVHDLERLVARVALRTAGPRDLVALRESAAMIPKARNILKGCRAPLIQSLVGQLDDVADVRRAIENTLVDQAPVTAREGGCIRDGFDRELDELRSLSRNAKKHISAMETSERERTGISSLKVRFNRVYGYYIEVSKSNLHAVPEDYERKQTVTTGERFVTLALKKYEEKALGADDRALEMEQVLFESLREQVLGETIRIQESARGLAGLDVVAGLAESASVLNYTKPEIHNGSELLIEEGRHPVVERHCPDSFVPNDLLLNNSTQQLIIITGPNMGGKSTFLRQAALITLLAHIGSFVPAKRAKVPTVDRIFARVGASDNIAKGQSTFMLEMQETAKILNTATSRSLVLLDEIGRGTATFDGLSLAWAVAEHLATDPSCKPKTLFATHYHELNDLADAIPGVANYHVVAREWKDDIIFLRRVEPGRSDRSYGIQVARLAGLPSNTVRRAREILAGLENDELSRGGRPAFSVESDDPSRQLGLFQAAPTGHARVAERLQALEIDRLTPIDAMNLLAELKKELNNLE